MLRLSSLMRQHSRYEMLLWPSLLCALLLGKVQTTLGWGPVRRSGPAFVPSISGSFRLQPSAPLGARRLWTAPVATNPETSETVSFVQTELRKEAMRLHTRDQVRG